MIVLIGLVARWLDLHAERNKFWLRISNHEVKRPMFPMLFHLQVHSLSIPSIGNRNLTTDNHCTDIMMNTFAK
jgi:phosphatidylinositol glycan class N